MKDLTQLIDSAETDEDLMALFNELGFDSLFEEDNPYKDDMSLLETDIKSYMQLGEDFGRYLEWLPKHHDPITNESFFKYIKDNLNPSKGYLESIERLAEESDGEADYELVQDLLFAANLNKMIEAFIKALDESDIDA